MGIWCVLAAAGALADNGVVPGLLREGRVTANGLRFAYLEGGSGPLVVLLHGWPDTPHTWDKIPTMPPQSAGGRRLCIMAASRYLI
jgi:hypothetical protein